MGKGFEVVGEFEVESDNETLKFSIIKADGTNIAVVDEESVEEIKALKLVGRAAKKKGAKCLFVYGDHDNEIYFPRVIDLETKQVASFKFCRGIEANSNKPMECLKFIPVVLNYIVALGW